MGGNIINRQDVANVLRAALAALLTTNSITAAAEASGLSGPTLHRYLADPKFQARLHDLRREALSQTTTALAAGAAQAVGELEKILTDAQASDRSKLSAAKIWLFEQRQHLLLDAHVDSALDARHILFETGSVPLGTRSVNVSKGWHQLTCASTMLRWRSQDRLHRAKEVRAELSPLARIEA